MNDDSGENPEAELMRDQWPVTGISLARGESLSGMPDVDELDKRAAKARPECGEVFFAAAAVL